VSQILPERVSTIDDALELEWYAGDTIIAYVLAKMSPEILQNWSKAALNVLNNWPTDKPYLALYDLSHSGIIIDYLNLVQRKMCSLGITEEGEKRALASVAQRENSTVRVALYASLRHSGYVAGLFAAIDARKKVIQYDVFYDREAALNWLKKVS
jgi:hypothetical protein